MKLFSTTLTFILLFSFTAIAQKRKSDRETDGLKGAVKYVSSEKTDVTTKAKKMIESKPILKDEITYNEKGERLNYKNYDYVSGYLFEDRDYAFLDGERISIEKDIDYPDKMTGVIVGESKPKKEPDPRYDYKFKYKYDDNGNMIEESWIKSDGDLWLKYVYNYKGNEREELVYSANGSLNQKYIYKFDDKGNDIEMFSYNIKTNRVDGKEFYKYLKFDVNDNWTKRIVSKNEEDNLKVMTPYKIQYRKIIYY